jgi:hypothetical protein
MAVGVFAAGLNIKLSGHDLGPSQTVGAELVVAEVQLG